MTAPTLPAFLLARIAEDEARVGGIHQGEDPDFFWGPDRIRRECEAKRRIVGWHSEWAHVCPSGLNHWTPDEEWIGCPELLALALPYADHEDYDESWKP